MPQLCLAHNLRKGDGIINNVGYDDDDDKKGTNYLTILPKYRIQWKNGTQTTTANLTFCDIGFSGIKKIPLIIFLVNNCWFLL